MTMTISRPHDMLVDRNHDQEPSNAERSSRIDTLFQTYWTVINEPHAGENIDPDEAASLITDLRHWCDYHGQNFYALISLSYRSYLEERSTTRSTH